MCENAFVCVKSQEHTSVYLSHRDAEAWGPFLFGQQVTEVGRVITVHVMVIRPVYTPSPSLAPQRMEISPGIWRSVAPSWPQPTAVESSMRGGL